MTKWCFSLAALAALNAQAVEVEVTIKPLFSVTGGAFSGLDAVRAQVFSPAGTGSAQVTHLITGPLSPPPGNENVIGGTYHGVNSATGEHLETGVIAFQVAGGVSSNGDVVSPIIAVIPRAGDWTSVTTAPVTTTLGNAQGSSDYAGGVLDFNLANPSASGSANMRVLSQTELEIEPFSLTVGSVTYNFEDAYLELAGGTYSGVILPTSASATLDEVAYVLTLTSPDSDNDGTPDLTDADNFWYSPFQGYENDLVISEWYGAFWFLPTEEQWIYHERHGIQFIMESDDGWIYAWDKSIADYQGSTSGWIGLSRDVYPYVYIYGLSGGSWTYFHPETGGWHVDRWFFFYDGPMATTGSNGSGWWGLPGAR